MKKLIAVVCMMALVGVFAVPAFADAGVEKLKGGFEQIIKSPVQISDSVQEEYESAEFKPFGVLGGTLKGLFLTAKELVSGTVDVVTFPFDCDK